MLGIGGIDVAFSLPFPMTGSTVSTVPNFVPTTKPHRLLPNVTTSLESLAGHGIRSTWAQFVTLGASS
jgi:hypothetical protein